ncbi:unnamed protein product [Arabis nemorensis]|uniref:Secreted protein n=1 Tax=Arabis nemorensis TaxID=586526 RepID=A0A565C143_9BRAS|nr:unnamed protein product [Arabis nemorensis]
MGPVACWLLASQIFPLRLRAQASALGAVGHVLPLCVTCHHSRRNLPPRVCAPGYLRVHASSRDKWEVTGAN